MSFFSSPLEWLLNRRIERQNDIKSKKRRAAQSLRAPPKRTSKLAASLAFPGSTTHPQPQSPLFARLPAEVRRLIFEYALGGATFHLTKRQRDLRPGSWTCGSPDACRALRTKHCARPWEAKLDGESINRCLLAVPLACRRCYFESLDALYACNAFITLHPDCLEFMPSLIQPPQLAAIRQLSFSLEFRAPPRPDLEDDRSSDYKTVLWISTWRNVALMTRLETLCVEVVATPSAGWAWVEHEEEILSPLRAVTAPSSFHIYLAYTDAPCQVERLPCHVHRTLPKVA